MATERPTIKTPEFRGSFVSLVKPRAFEEGKEPTYQITIVLPKKDPATKKFIAEFLAAVKAASTAAHGVAIEPKKLKHFPIQDGDTKDIENFVGCYVIRASSRFKPSAVDKTGDKLETEDELYSGAWYRCKISVWGWKHTTGGKGVSVSVDSVLKTRDDDRFGGGSNAADDFADDLEEGGGAGDSDDDDASLF